MNIPLHFFPRDYQVKALSALERGVEMAVLCWSRRAGKDMTSFAYAVKKMVESPINVVLVFPTKDQGKTAFWENIENDGFKTIERIPKELIARQDNTNMRLVLKNGSTFQVLGTTDTDALRGANGKIYIFSEFVDIPGSALKVIRPIVANNKGQIIIISTPKIDGISGASFKILFDRALAHPNRYASIVTAPEYMDKDVLEDLRQDAIAEYGNDFFWRQEYLCDWGQVSSSSYYGTAISLMKKRNLLGNYPYNKSYPVYTAWDFGISDSTAIVFFQYIAKKVRIIDYYETSDIGNAPIVKYVQSKPYNYGWHFFPHDGAARDSDAVSRIEKLRELGLINSSLLTRESKTEGIKRAIVGISKTEVNKGTTEDLIKKLLLYKRKFNPVTGDYIGPEHKTESHAADAVKYLYASLEQFFDIKTGEFLYSPANMQESYEIESDFISGQYALPHGFA